MKKNIIFLSVVGLIFLCSPVFADKPDRAQCPQDRKTPEALPSYLKLKNPLEVSTKRLQKGELETHFRNIFEKHI